MNKNKLLPIRNTSYLVLKNQTSNELVFENGRLLSVGLCSIITMAFLGITLHLYFNHPEDLNSLFPGVFLIVLSSISLLGCVNYAFLQEKLTLSKDKSETTYSLISIQEKINWTKKFSDFEHIYCVLEPDSDADLFWFFYLKTSENQMIPVYKGLTGYNKKQKDKAVAFAENIAIFMNIPLVVDMKE